MMALQQPQTTSSGLKGNRGRYNLETPPPADNVSFNQEQVGKQYGWVRVMSAERRYMRGWGTAMVLTQCTGCGAVQWQNLSNLLRGLSKGCQPCSQPQQVPVWLLKRCTAMRQRCQNADDKAWVNYGARGIEFRFETVLACALWVKETLGLQRGLELDRIDNDGHYEPGNLRYATRQQQARNTRCAIVSSENLDWARTLSPYHFTTTERKLRTGMTPEEIVSEAQDAVVCKRKNWRGIQDRLYALGYMTS